MAGVVLDFVILGAQKSGTTFVQACLSEHPSIYMPKGETPVFEDPDFSTDPETDLRELAAPKRPEQLFGIKRPSYLALPYVAERIKQIAPEAKLVVVLRNPVDRAVSAYFHNIRYGFLPCVPVEQGLSELLQNGATDHPGRSREILEFGFYGRQLRTYLDLFQREQFVVLLQEDLQQNPLPHIQRVYAFLGVDEAYVPRSLKRRINAGTYSLKPLKLAALENRVRFTYNEPRDRLALKRLTYRDRLAVVGLELLQKVFCGGHSRRHVVLSAVLFEALHVLYQDDVLALCGLGLVRQDPWSDFQQFLP